jgi:Zn-dependent M28 family amino/carboxypeptidase
LFGTAKATQAVTAPQPIPLIIGNFVPDPAVADMMAQVQADQVYTYDASLSGVVPATVGGAPYTFATRHTDSGEPVQKATQYVYEHLQALGLNVSYEPWSANGHSGRNVVGVLTGTTEAEQVVQVSAHVDSIVYGGPVTRAPGADDNGSGVTSVFVIADILSHHTFQRTIRFVVYTGEEELLLGSRADAQAEHVKGEDIVADYNMDMIGYNRLNDGFLELHTRRLDQPGSAGDLMIAQTFTTVVSSYGLSPLLKPIIKSDSMGLSDHEAFWKNGYPAILAIEDYAHDKAALHTLNDTLQNMNLPYFTRFVQASVGTVAHLARLVSLTKAQSTQRRY